MSRRSYAMMFLIYCLQLACLSIKSAAQAEKGADLASIKESLNPDSVIILFKKILPKYIAANNADSAFHILINLGIKYAEKQEYAKSREYSLEAIPWAERSSQKDAVAWAYNNIGDAYSSEGDYLKATEYFYIALNELKKATTAPTHTGVNIYNNLGIINTRLNQPGTALAYFNEAENMARKGNLYYQLANALTLKGGYYNSIHKPDSARKYFTEAMDIGKKINKLDLEATANSELGKTAIATGDYELAIGYLQQAVLLAKDVYDYITVDASCAMGDAWYHEGKYKQAEAILVSTLQEMKAHNIRDKYMDCYTGLAAVYKAEGRYKESLAFTDSLLTIKDTLTGIEKTTAYNQLELKYKTAEKDKQIAVNQLQIAEQQSKITRENIWIAAIIGGIFLLGLVVTGVYRNARHKQRLQAEQIRSLEQQNKIGTLKAVVQGEENERGRIARELHDGIGGILAAAMMRFRTIRHDNEAVTITPAYNEAMDMLGQMADEIRKTAHNLMPEVLQKQDLAEAVRAFCNNMQEAGTLKIDFQAYGSFGNISQEVKLNVYRILQELLKNIKQHANAAHALVQLLVNEQTLTITVEDNGAGYDTAEKNNGIGLHNMETRVRSLGGSYTIESEAGKGTTVYIEFEMQQAATNQIT